MLLAPMLKKYFYGNNKPGLVAEMIIISFSAQLPCLPISMYYYGQFSVIGLIANILVTPVISCVMLLTFLCGVFPYPASSLLAFADNLLLNYQITTIQWLSDIKWATINLQPYRMAVFTLYLPMIIGAYFLKCRTKHTFKPAYNLDKTPDYGKIYSC